MGFNIQEVTGATGGGLAGLDTWTFDVTLNGTGITTVSGDFDAVPIGGGTPSEAVEGYGFVVQSGGAYGSLISNDITGEFTFVIDRSAVFASGEDQTVVISVTGNDTDGSDTDTVNINLLICVARGTLIDTKSGPVPVENLSPGDLVRTVDGPPQSVRWVGCRHVSRVEMRADPSLRPIRIEAGAFGEDGPSRDLIVSPQHRILLGGWQAELHFGVREVLVPAKGLVNNQTIRLDTNAKEVDYFHILLDRHEIMFTEGLPTESFHPGEYALSEIGHDAREELFALFPELSDEKAVPETARTVLRPWQGAVFQECVAQHTYTEEWRLAS